jgi:hypothetical protein
VLPLQAAWTHRQVLSQEDFIAKKLSAAGCVELEHDPEDYQFSPEEFEDLQREFGRFTVDLTADPQGANSLCPRHYSKLDEPLYHDLSGENCWCNAPFKDVYVVSLLTHYLHCKAAAPDRTSGCFVLPVWRDASWWPLVHHMRAVRYYPRGTMLFTANSQHAQGERQRTGPTRWPVVVLRDDPGVMPSADVTRLPPLSSQQLSNLQEDSQPLIEFTATVNHHPCQVLVDCGATTDHLRRLCPREGTTNFWQPY